MKRDIQEGDAGKMEDREGMWRRGWYPRRTVNDDAAHAQAMRTQRTQRCRLLLSYSPLVMTLVAVDKVTLNKTS